MSKRKAIAALAVMLAAGAVQAAVERSTEEEALALIRSAQAYIKTNGLERAVEEFNRLDSPYNSKSEINPKGDLYLYTLDQKGYQAVHGKNPKIRGKVMIEMRDSDGVFVIRELAKKCYSPEGRGWANYRWPNPVTGNLESKVGYVERVPGMDLCLGTGIYK